MRAIPLHIPPARGKDVLFLLLDDAAVHRVQPAVFNDVGTPTDDKNLCRDCCMRTPPVPSSRRTQRSPRFSPRPLLFPLAHSCSASLFGYCKGGRHTGGRARVVQVGAKRSSDTRVHRPTGSRQTNIFLGRAPSSLDAVGAAAAPERGSPCASTVKDGSVVRRPCVGRDGAVPHLGPRRCRTCWRTCRSQRLPQPVYRSNLWIVCRADGVQERHCVRAFAHHRKLASGRVSALAGCLV